MSTEIPPELITAADNLQADQYNLLVASDLLLSAPKGNTFIPFDVKFKWLADISIALTMIFAVMGIAIAFFSSYDIQFLGGMAAPISLYSFMFSAGFIALFTLLKVIPLSHDVTWNYIKARINHDIYEMSDAFSLFSYGVKLRFGESESYEIKQEFEMMEAQLQTIESALNTKDLEAASYTWDLEPKATTRLPAVSSFSFIGSFSSLLIGNDFIASLTDAPIGSNLYPIGLGIILLIVGLISGMAHLWGTVKGHSILADYRILAYEKAFAKHHRQMATLITLELDNYLSEHSKMRGKGDPSSSYKNIDTKAARRIIGKP
ncbi:MAG: hypothetical protein ACFFC7_17380 [Candidatus Hermodarchaeota archaeon]